jgi:hypothetical protein
LALLAFADVLVFPFPSSFSAVVLSFSAALDFCTAAPALGLGVFDAALALGFVGALVFFAAEAGAGGAFSAVMAILAMFVSVDRGG